MNKEIREKAEKFWKELCENASAWDNDDGKMAEANEKTPVDLLEDVFFKRSKGRFRGRTMYPQRSIKRKRYYST